MNTVERLENKARKTFKNAVDVRFRIAMPNDIKVMFLCRVLTLRFIEKLSHLY